MTLDLSFLSAPWVSAPSAPRPVNVYDVLQEGWRESRVDMTLQFFLDPNERHGLGSLVIDALLRVLDDAATIGPAGKTATLLAAEDFSGSDSWEISTQTAFIDVYAEDAEQGIAVVLENKIGHHLANPLDQYAAHALGKDGISTVLVAVLAPERRTAPGGQEMWLSRSITYSELTEEIKRSPELIDHLMGPADLDQRRSIDLLQQFIEARNGDTNMPDLADEAAQLGQWRDVLDQHGDAIQDFLEARRRARRLLRERGKRLEPLIAEGLNTAGLEVGWQAHSGNGEEFWNAYHFKEAEWTIELKLTTNPKLPSIFVYDYPGRTYKNETREGLGLEWSATDHEVADAFVERARSITEQAKHGTRNA